ncbi:MAG: response regulator [Deltaproteobacteria bacterium]|jgi:signal transduction histidine kinase/ActR/RegA family two-component response regulator|nr:response regulator [Deltaproteobacteria bacterium]
MSFRWKVFLVSVAITLTIIMTTIGASRYFIQRGIRETILSDLSIMADLAESLISSDIKVSKANVFLAVHTLDTSDPSEWPTIMEREVESNQLFYSITIMDEKEVLASYGPPAPVELYHGFNARNARERGQAVITSSYTLPTGELVFFIYAPMKNGRVAAVAIPGLHFVSILQEFKVWSSGSVMIFDENGKLISNQNVGLVLAEYNVVKNEEDTIDVRTIKAFVTTALKEKQGQSSYVLDDRERLVYYKEVTASDRGWLLCVTAPLRESPLAFVDQGVVIMTIVFLSLGLLCGWFISGFIDRQFKIINEQYSNLEKMSEVAKNASEAKTNFLANMSHEMRTPLNAIIGFSDLMLCGRYNARESQSNMHKINSAGLILLGIINDILDISKIEAGYLEIIEMEYDLSSLVNDAVTVNLIRIGSKPIEFNVSIDPTLPNRLIGDELRIKQICSNLLSNAFKYTESGQVELFVSGHLEEEKTVWLTISVRDTGLGIKAEDQEKLFSDYSQVDTRSNRKIEGTGLGLSIVKKMVEKMGGHIEVESEYGRGSTFRVTIPQGLGQSQDQEDKAPEGALKPTPANLNLPGERRRIIPMPYARILLVDDVQANLDVSMGILKPYGLKIDCVTSGQAAVDLIKGRDPVYNAIFMDHMMPGMDGVEAVRIIRQEIGTEYAKGIPIIALTANAIVGIEKMFLENGFQAYLTKPVDINRMDQVLRQLVRDKRMEESFSEGEIAVGYGEDDLDDGHDLHIPGLMVEEAMERFGGDREVFLSVLRSYVSSVETLAPKLENPSKDTLKDYTITVHGLKSSSYGVGANEVGDLAKELEARAVAGDLDYVLAKNSEFLAEVGRLVRGIRELISPESQDDDRPLRQDLDPTILERLAEASGTFDMDGIEDALNQLDEFKYEGPAQELLKWLKEMALSAAFDEMAARLTELKAGQASGSGAKDNPDAAV